MIYSFSRLIAVHIILTLTIQENGELNLGLLTTFIIKVGASKLSSVSACVVLKNKMYRNTQKPNNILTAIAKYKANLN